MSDLIKGIILGVVLVKVVESDTVQNYINKTIRKKCYEAGKNIVNAVFPVKEETEETSAKENEKANHGRYKWYETECFTYLYDAEGNPIKVNIGALKT